jgi:mersacidin/lichenicidin family type 2 lantibiotic
LGEYAAHSIQSLLSHVIGWARTQPHVIRGSVFFVFVLGVLIWTRVTTSLVRLNIFSCNEPLFPSFALYEMKAVTQGPDLIKQERGKKMKIDIARAWKDVQYRRTLTPEQLNMLPPNPAGSTQLTKEQLDEVSGGGIFSVGGESLYVACCGVQK